MGNIVEEITKRKALKLGLSIEEFKKYEKTKKFIERKSVSNILKRTTIHLLPAGKGKEVEFFLKMDSGSYTDGKKLVVGVPRLIWGMTEKIVFSVLKGLTGHEAEHIRSSDFKLFIKFQYVIGKNFAKFMHTGKMEKISLNKINSLDIEQVKFELRRFNQLESLGAKIARHLLNSVEDGAIEKILVNRMRGYLKHIKFMNALFWKKQPVKGDNELQDMLFCITFLSVTGMKSKDWNKHYSNTKIDKLINKVKPIIIKGINEATPMGRASRSLEIYEIIAPLIKEMIEQNKENQDSLDDMPMEFNFSTSPSQGDGEDDYPGNSVSTHFTPETDNEEEEDQHNNQDSQDNSGKSEHNEENDKTENGKSGEGNEDETSDDDNDNNSSGSKSIDGSVDVEPETNSSSGSNSSTDSENSDSNSSSDGKQQDSDDSDDEGKSNSSNKQNRKDENDLTDRSDERAKEEEELVNDFLKDTESQLIEEMEDDMEKIEKEEEKIKKEEERKKKESGNLSESELKEVITGERVRRIQQRILNLSPVTLPEDIRLEGRKLRKKLESILKDKQSYNSRNRRRGILDTRNLWRIGVKEYNVFMKKGKPDQSSYVVSILKDNSGSMNERVRFGLSKNYFANKALAILEEGLKGLVPFRIVQFNADFYNKTAVHEVISDYGDTENWNRSFATNSLRAYNGNADSVAIRAATKELLKRPEQKKILFVLSDGLPSMYESEEAAIAAVRDAVRDARKAGIIVIAICFGSESHIESTRNSYREMYQKGIIMTEPENVPIQLVKTLEREIK